MTIMDFLRYDDDSKDAVGYRLKLVRDALDASQSQMAHWMGTTTSNYQHMENGSTYPRPYHVQRLMRVTKVDHNFVYAGDLRGVPGDVAIVLEAKRQAHGGGSD